MKQRQLLQLWPQPYGTSTNKRIIPDLAGQLIGSGIRGQSHNVADECLSVFNPKGEVRTMTTGPTMQ